MSCNNMTEALLEDVIEITWMFDSLMKSGKIRAWKDMIDEFGSDGFKNEIKEIASEFEKKYPYETTWDNPDFDYIEEIEKFAEKKLIEIFGKKESELDLVDGVITCCGFDFGTDTKKAKYCPICGKPLVNGK